MRMRRLGRTFLWALVGLGMAGTLMTVGCVATQRTVNVASLSPPYRLEIQERGATVAEHAVASGSKDEQIINQWLQAHESGWRVDINTYAPDRRIKGDHFDINFAGKTCVVNYDPTGKGDWVQVSRRIGESDALPDLFTRDR